MVSDGFKQGRCGHRITKVDPHCVCFICRTDPEIVIPKYHHCQQVLRGELPDSSRCPICVSASPAVKESWFSTVCTCKCTRLLVEGFLVIQK